MLEENAWHNVESSCINSISYCMDSKIIGIRINNDDYFYEFSELNEDEIYELFSMFYKAKSKGKFYTSFIKKSKLKEKNK